MAYKKQGNMDSVTGKIFEKRLKIITEKGINTNKSYKQKIQVIRLNQVYFSSSNVSTDTTVIVKD